MPNAFCQKCGGDGVVPVLFINRCQKQYRTTCICCSLCFRHSDDLWDQHKNEEMVYLGKGVEEFFLAEGYSKVTPPHVDISWVLALYGKERPLDRERM